MFDNLLLRHWACLQIHEVRNQAIGEPLIQVNELLFIQQQFDVNIVRLYCMMESSNFNRDLARAERTDVQVSYHRVPVDILAIKLWERTYEESRINVRNRLVIQDENIAFSEPVESTTVDILHLYLLFILYPFHLKRKKNKNGLE